MQPSQKHPFSNSGRLEAPTAALLVEVTRDPIVESRHRGHIAAVHNRGRLLASLGSPEEITYLRSSAKPLQALPLVASGAADRFGFTEEEVALACASHNGEPIHTRLAQSMLNKIGLPPSALKCGVHEPYSEGETLKLRARGEAPNVLHNNCSGKHAGMLALALHLGAPTETYDQPDHPVQREIIKAVSRFSETPVEKMALGIDGCGIPCFGLSLRAMALMYARLVAPPASFDDATRTTCRRIVSAMVNHPELIGGSVNRLDTELLRTGSGRLISKVGAEGVYTAGILPCPDWPNGLGLAVKIEDGENHRARPAVVIEALRQLGILDDQATKRLDAYAHIVIRNRNGDAVGDVRPVFQLKQSGNDSD